MCEGALNFVWMKYKQYYPFYMFIISFQKKIIKGIEKTVRIIYNNLL